MLGQLLHMAIERFVMRLHRRLLLRLRRHGMRLRWQLLRVLLRILHSQQLLQLLHS
jgi:hypothetical protein